ncbi:MAG: cobalt ECF transporter T component CbiQ [Alphaproteobacteria bacterium]|nr:cobalt ECF transporter T component CbiQ [Alphaproteobacteria bacterium]
MEHGFIDRHSCISSPVHRIDARVKIVVALAFIIIVVTTPPQRLGAFVVYAGLLSWVVALSRVPLSFVVTRSLMVLPFSALVALGLPFLDGSETVVFLGVNLSVKGLWVLAGAAMKSVLGVAALLMLVSTTPFNSLMAGLRSLGAPDLFIDILSLTYRYMFVLIDESMRLKRAAFARGYSPRWLPQAVIIGQQIGNLFVRSYNRAETIYGAMRLRGYDGSMPSKNTASFGLSDVAVLAVVVPSIIAVRLFVR